MGEIQGAQKRMEAEQRKQSSQLGRLNKVVFGDEDTPGMKGRLEETADTVEGWAQKWQGARLVIGGVVFVLTSGAASAVIALLRGFFGASGGGG